LAILVFGMYLTACQSELYYLRLLMLSLAYFALLRYHDVYLPFICDHVILDGSSGIWSWKAGLCYLMHFRRSP